MSTKNFTKSNRADSDERIATEQKLKVPVKICIFKDLMIEKIIYAETRIKLLP